MTAARLAGTELDQGVEAVLAVPGRRPSGVAGEQAEPADAPVARRSAASSSVYSGEMGAMKPTDTDVERCAARAGPVVRRHRDAAVAKRGEGGARRHLQPAVGRRRSPREHDKHTHNRHGKCCSCWLVLKINTETVHNAFAGDRGWPARTHGRGQRHGQQHAVDAWRRSVVAGSGMAAPRLPVGGGARR